MLTGALVALQSSEGLDASKLVFFAIAAVAVGGSVIHWLRARNTPEVAIARPWLIASIVLIAIIGVSMPVAMLHGIGISAWVRDAAAYVLVAASPWLALDLAGALSPRAVTWTTIAAGFLAAVSFTIAWVQRRGLVDLPVDRLVLPSFMLAAALFALAIAGSVWYRRSRTPMALLGAATIGLLLVTGTRTTLALLAVPVVLVIAAWRIGGVRALRNASLAILPSLVVTLVLTGPGLVRSFAPPTSAIPTAAPTALATPGQPAATSGPPASTPEAALATPGQPAATSGPPASTPEAALATPGQPAATSGPPASTPEAAPDAGGRYDTFGDVIAGNDWSLRQRWEQTVSAWNLFLAAPLLGNGPGVPIPWHDSLGTTIAVFTADTPLTILAKFGILGIVVWVVLGWALLRTLRDVRRLGPAGVMAHQALLGFAVAIVALSPFGAQLEDKGTGLALVLLLGLAFGTILEQRERSLEGSRRRSL